MSITSVSEYKKEYKYDTLEQLKERLPYVKSEYERYKRYTSKLPFMGDAVFISITGNLHNAEEAIKQLIIEKKNIQGSRHRKR